MNLLEQFNLLCIPYLYVFVKCVVIISVRTIIKGVMPHDIKTLFLLTLFLLGGMS